MSDQYLWDRTGQPDPEIARLEELLQPLRHQQPLRRARPVAAWYGIAAALGLMVGAGAWYQLRAPQPEWAIQRNEGSPRVGSSVIGEAGKLRLGQTLETDASSRATLDVADIGELKVDPNTRLKMSESKTGAHRISLERGVIHAMIWAPPRNFVVDTPSAKTIDLGCKYTLQVSDDGSGYVQVESGWVAFESHGRESFIPKGAMCATSRRDGPGVPFYLDAPEELRAALQRPAWDVPAVLRQARRKDAMTLWHLLPRVAEPMRGQVYDALAALVPPPAGVTRAGIMKLAPKELDEWWNELGLHNTTWWRKMERGLD